MVFHLLGQDSTVGRLHRSRCRPRHPVGLLRGRYRLRHLLETVLRQDNRLCPVIRLS